MKQYSLYCVPHYDSMNGEYVTIMTVRPRFDEAPMNSLVRTISRSTLSPYKAPHNCCNEQCMNAIMSDETNRDFWCFDRFPDFIVRLFESGYTVDTQITKLIHRTTEGGGGDRFIALITRP